MPYRQHILIYIKIHNFRESIRRCPLLYSLVDMISLLGFDFNTYFLILWLWLISVCEFECEQTYYTIQTRVRWYPDITLTFFF